MSDAVTTPRAVEWCNAATTACEGVPDLQAGIVFGSMLTAKGAMGFDLALLWSPELPTVQRRQRTKRIATDLEHRIAQGSVSVNVKDLRKLPLVLKFRVLRDGCRVYEADRHALVRFQSETVPRALDFIHFQQKAIKASARH